nr:integrase core domain-containing protein [Acinetobacter sp. Marseille-Q1618]
MDFRCGLIHLRIIILNNLLTVGLCNKANGLYKTEVIEYLKADWQGLADVQLATLNWVDWFNKKRIHSALDYVSPFDFEAMYYDKINLLGQVA